MPQAWSGLDLAHQRQHVVAVGLAQRAVRADHRGQQPDLVRRAWCGSGPRTSSAASPSGRTRGSRWSRRLAPWSTEYSADAALLSLWVIISVRQRLLAARQRRAGLLRLVEPGGQDVELDDAGGLEGPVLVDRDGRAGDLIDDRRPRSGRPWRRCTRSARPAARSFIRLATLIPRSGGATCVAVNAVVRIGPAEHRPLPVSSSAAAIGAAASTRRRPSAGRRRANDRRTSTMSSNGSGRPPPMWRRVANCRGVMMAIGATASSQLRGFADIGPSIR